MPNHSAKYRLLLFKTSMFSEAPLSSHNSFVSADSAFFKLFSRETVRPKNDGAFEMHFSQIAQQFLNNAFIFAKPSHKCRICDHKSRNMRCEEVP
jgi:hypothetical protein